MNILLVSIAVLLASCDQKPAAPSAPAEESSNESWFERSERICGPGYLSIKTTSFTGTRFNRDIHFSDSVCIPYKVPDQITHRSEK
jgi:hypothetical protein